MPLTTRILDSEIAYDGSQLRSLFAYDTCDVQGDSLIAFVGPCDVTRESMVDREDVKQKAVIRAKSMLHFISEHYDERLPAMVLRQHLFARIAADHLSAFAGKRVEVAGDDLFVSGKKASISIATVSPVSGLFHFALNIDPTGAPVAAIGLLELGIDWRSFSERVLEAWGEECADLTHAATKVRWVS